MWLFCMLGPNHEAVRFYVTINKIIWFYDKGEATLTKFISGILERPSIVNKPRQR